MKRHIISHSIQHQTLELESGLPSLDIKQAGKPNVVWPEGTFSDLKRLKIMCIILIGLIFMFQCTPDAGHTQEEENHAHTNTSDAEDHHEDENLVTLTPVQAASAGIAYGTFDTMNTSGFVRANGVLDLPPQNVAAISAPMPGFVKKANYLVGAYVKKGAVLAVLEHPDFLKIQEEYLMLASQIEYLKAEWLRQKQLDSANIAAKKRFQEAEATYQTSAAREKSLEKQLLYIGLQPDEIRKGSLSSTIFIKAPFSGYITQLNTHNGMYVRPEEELYEMIDMEHMHLELNVFEKDIPKVKVGQEIKFKVPSLGEEEYEGEVFLVGKSFDMENKTIRVHGHIEHDQITFIRGLYLEATIYTSDQKVMALPEEAVIRDEGQYYIFLMQRGHNDHHSHSVDENHDHPHESEASQNHEHDEEEENHGHLHDEEHTDHEDASSSVSFQRTLVIPGIAQNGWIEIKNYPELPPNAQIVVKGAYDLYAEMKKGEGGHHHH